MNEGALESGDQVNLADVVSEWLRIGERSLSAYQRNMRSHAGK
jgi:RNA polymerase-interacting CarD/CdnL/TRCF family regulator